jgi:hypothetical protein
LCDGCEPAGSGSGDQSIAIGLLVAAGELEPGPEGPSARIPGVLALVDALAAETVVVPRQMKHPVVNL